MLYLMPCTLVRLLASCDFIWWKPDSRGMTCLSFGNVFNCKSVFQAFYQKCFSILWGIFLNILKVPPSIYVYISECKLPWVCFGCYTEQKWMSIKYAGPIFWSWNWLTEKWKIYCLNLNTMLKRKIVPFGKTLFMGGGDNWGVIQKI